MQAWVQNSSNEIGIRSPVNDFYDSFFRLFMNRTNSLSNKGLSSSDETSDSSSISSSMSDELSNALPGSEVVLLLSLGSSLGAWLVVGLLGVDSSPSPS